MRFQRVVVLGLVAMWLAAAAGSAAAAAPPLAAVGETIDVRVVNVEAVVTDSRGHRVRGLAPSDFRLLVDGKETPIEYFTEVADGQTACAATSPPAGTLSPVEPGAVARSFLVFVDHGFSVARDLAQVLNGLERNLDRLGPGDRMAIVAWNGQRLEALTGWTSDRARLAAALERARALPSGGLQVLAERNSAQSNVDLAVLTRGTGDLWWGLGGRVGLRDLGATRVYPSEVALPFPASPLLPVAPSGPPAVPATFRVPHGLSAEAYADLRTSAPLAAAAALRGMPPAPGRKVMLVLSGGWPFVGQPRLYSPLTEAANLLGYTLYAVDVPGHDPLSPAVDASAPGPRLDESSRTISSDWEQQSHQTLGFLAEETGGGTALRGNRLYALARAVEDTGSYYWLGFSPAWQADDRHHAIRLEPRRRGIEVRARSGFSDLSPATRSALRAESLLLLGDDKGRHLIVTLGQPRRAGLGRMEVPVTLEVAAEVLVPAAATGEYVARTLLSMAAVDRSGGRASLAAMPLQLVFPRGEAAGRSARLETTVKLRRTAQRLVFTIADPATGNEVWQEVEVNP
ncbi:MAG TPA: VWA domain-containing protein [Thermoanaerobaculia bacterium]|nr:VWA domain-containing protein [Thermoanaerobaculia bacterium]